RIQLCGIGSELNLFPEVRRLERRFELLSGPHDRFWLPARIDRQHSDACGLLLEFTKLGAEMLVFLLKLTEMSGELGLRLKPANRITQVLEINIDSYK